MILLEAVKFHGLFRLWNVPEKKVTEPLFFSEILKCINDEDIEWMPGTLDWYLDEEIDFKDWQEMPDNVLSTLINE